MGWKRLYVIYVLIIWLVKIVLIYVWLLCVLFKIIFCYNIIIFVLNGIYLLIVKILQVYKVFKFLFYCYWCLRLFVQYFFFLRLEVVCLLLEICYFLYVEVKRVKI